MTRNLIYIFLAAVFLNFVWEELHSVLYLSYQGGEITNLILLRAALFDAAVIAIFAYPFFRFAYLRQSRWILYAALVIFAIVLERWALGSGRWVYADAMPIIPLLNVGLTPAIQLGILGFVSLRLSDLLSQKI